MSQPHLCCIAGHHCCCSHHLCKVSRYISKQHMCMELYTHERDALHMPPYCLQLRQRLKIVIMHQSQGIEDSVGENPMHCTQMGPKQDSQLMQASLREVVLASWLCCGDSKQQS